MDVAELCRASRRSASSAWKGMTAIGSLRFPDDAQEGRFVQNAGEHGLGVMRYSQCPVPDCLKLRKSIAHDKCLMDTYFTKPAFQICCRQAPTCFRLEALALALPMGNACTAESAENALT